MKPLLKRLFLILSIILLGPLCWADQAALVIIDMQDYFISRKGFAENPENIQKLNLVLDRQIELIAVAKANQMPIVVVEFRGEGPTTSRLLEAIGEYEGVRFFSKKYDGVFEHWGGARRRLLRHLNRLHVTNLIMVGANGGACMKCSIEGAIEKGMRVIADNRGIIDFNYSRFIYPYYYDLEKMEISWEDYKKLNQYSDLQALESIQELQREGLISTTKGSLTDKFFCRKIFRKRPLDPFRSLIRRWSR